MFAALTYAVTQTGRGARNIDPEKAALAAASLMQFASDIEAGFARTKLTGKYDWSEINYGGTNSDCTSTKCELFNTGRGVAPQLSDVPKEAVGHTNSETARIRFVDVEGVGTDDPDLGILIAGLSYNVCKAVNDAVGITSTNSSGLPAYYNSSGGTGPHDIHAASYSSSSLRSVRAASNADGYLIEHVGQTGYSAEVAGHKTFCVCVSTSITSCDSADPWNTRFWHIIQVR